MFVMLLALITPATVVALLPLTSFTKYPLIKRFRSAVSKHSLVPITEPYFPPPFVYLYTDPSYCTSPAIRISPGAPTNTSLPNEVMSVEYPN